ncbi:phe13-bombesin receptor-like [Lytechinus pictus]|uniref:phe13-bombesin receptor-like n=1 Tax=Lytechinus pictus TaxID=7653 RepID=UPI00240E7676|nr:phe13-bombesin receptor-like [Lytechinus pictus]
MKSISTMDTTLPTTQSVGLNDQADYNDSYSFYGLMYDYSTFDPDGSFCHSKGPKFARDATLLGIFFLVGFLGNCFLMMVILSNPRLRTSANILLTNLAMGDLLYVMVSGPFFLEHELHSCWQYGLAGCKLVNFTQVMVQGVCVYTLTALSIERYSVLVRGGTIRHGGRMRRGILSAVTVWFIAAVVASPILVYAYVSGGSSPVCHYIQNFTRTAKVYEVARAMVMYLLPLVIITFLYTVIAQTLLKSAGAFAGETQPGARHFSARRRLALTVLILALFFGIFWLPYYIFIVWFQLDHSSLVHMTGVAEFRNIYYFSALANSCLNPIIIFSMSTSHRRALLICVRCRKAENPTSVAHTRSLANGIPGEKVKQPIDSRSGSRNTRCTEL